MLEALTGMETSGAIGGGIVAGLLAMFAAITKAAVSLSAMASTAKAEFEARGKDREAKVKHYESAKRFHDRMHQHLEIEEAHFGRQEKVDSLKLDALRHQGDILKNVANH